ncbi:MAG: hypothetical protein HFH06_09345 [Lachnospiraceae bacterium]|nr:hypothetical protein [Lachnospiraceae bacterium]
MGKSIRGNMRIYCAFIHEWYDTIFSINRKRQRFRIDGRMEEREAPDLESGRKQQ